MFDKFVQELQTVCASGYSPEILVFRTYFDILLTSVSGERRAELDMDVHTLEAFWNISKILKSISSAQGHDLITQIEVTKSAFHIVIDRLKPLAEKQAST